MDTITIQDLKNHGARALPDGRISYLIVNSQPKCVILPIDEYRALTDAVEELDDVRSIQQSQGRSPLHWKQVFGDDTHMPYTMEFTQNAADQIKRLPQSIARELQSILFRLRGKPLVPEARNIHGYEYHYRAKFGQHHIAFQLIPGIHKIRLANVQYTVWR